MVKGFFLPLPVFGYSKLTLVIFLFHSTVFCFLFLLLSLSFPLSSTPESIKPNNNNETVSLAVIAVAPAQFSNEDSVNLPVDQLGSCSNPSMGRT